MAEEPKRRKLKPSEKLFCEACAIGYGLAGGLYWVWSGMVWWVYLVIGFLLSAMFFDELLKQEARRRIVDGE